MSGWVWHSSEASLEQGKVSILACVETLLSVVAFFAIYVYWGFPLKWSLISIIAAPLVLLRCDESIEYTYNKIEDTFDNYSKISVYKNIIILILQILALFSMPIIIFIVILYGRFISIFKYFTANIENLNKNWNSLLFKIDICDEPMLLPNNKKYDTEFTVKAIWKYWNSEDSIAKLILAPVWILFTIILTIPALIWRYSLKSTAWFWWPLVMIAHRPANFNDVTERKNFLQDLHSSRQEKLRLWLIIPLVLLTLLATFPPPVAWPEMLKAAAIPYGALAVYVGYIDLSKMTVWQFTSFMSAAITLYLWLNSDNTLRRAGNFSLDEPKVARSLVLYCHLVNIRNVCTYVYLFFALIGLILLFTEIESLLPAAILEGLEFLFRQKMPMKL